MKEKTSFLSIQLLSNTPMVLNHDLYVSSLQKYCGKNEIQELSNNVIQAFHHHLPLSNVDNSIVTQSMLTHSSIYAPPENFAEILQQTWSFPAAEQVVNECCYKVSLHDFMGLLINPMIRIHLFSKVIQAALETFPNTIALYWESSQCFIEPNQFIHAISENMIFSNGPINVRLYSIANQDNEVLMDTLGMEVFNLPDIQCHFKKFNASDIAQYLFNLSQYLLEHGNIIASGNTIEGILPEHRWECEYQNSLVQPQRQVLNINTGLG